MSPVINPGEARAASQRILILPALYCPPRTHPPSARCLYTHSISSEQTKHTNQSLGISYCVPKALALPGYPDTYQVILLALGRVLGVPLLFPASLLKIIVAAIVVVTRVAASAPASTSGSKLLWHKEGKRNKGPCQERRKPVPCILFKHISGTEYCCPAVNMLVHWFLANSFLFT